ncbi:hypothetical protein [Arthrobacter sp. NPDC058192]|uniref:hypothetical protein n=1 Tax=Arthrobacter sp. NPDC058192 TaxID=3346372 RepID=UPI0036E99778
MNPTQPSAPADVVGLSGPAEWWQVVGALGPLAILLSGLVAALISFLVLRQRTNADALELIQKTRADSRAEWWRRTQWALDRALDQNDDTKALGLGALAVLAQSELASAEELELLDIAWKAVNGEKPDNGEKPHADLDRAVAPERSEAAAPGRTSRPPSAASEQRVRVAAARLRVVLDGRLGRLTPAKTKALSKAGF